MSMSPQGEADQPAIAFRAGDLLVDTGRQRVTRDGVALNLPKLSYDLLLVLVRASPNLVSSDELLDKVWPKAIVSPETLSQRIKLLRDALGDNPRSPTYVEGLRGRGYRLIPAVERVAPLAATEAPPATAQSEHSGLHASKAAVAEAVAGAGAPAAPRPGKVRRAPILVAFVLGLVATLAAVYVYRERRQSAKSSVDVIAVQPRAVAVLPFDNQSEAPSGQYIAMGIAESVLNRLGSVRELIVIARSSSFSLAPRPDPREVARKLGVQYLVQGSVQRAGTRLRVNAQLVDAVLNREIWSLSMDRNLDDVFTMQDEIASRVAEKLQVSLSQSRPEYAAFGTEAYLALLHGRSLAQTRKLPDVESSIAEFSRALQLAPSFAAAMTDLASAKLLLSSTRADFYRQQSTLLPELKALVSRAIELDPGAGASYYMRAQLNLAGKANSEEVERDFRKGLDLAPNDAFGIFNYGAFLYQLGRNDEALALLDRASLLDPMTASTHYMRGQILFANLGRLEEAIASYRQALAAAPDFYPAYTRLGLALFFQGKLAEALQMAEKSIAIEPKVGWTRARLIWLYLHLGDLDAARDAQRGFDAKDSSGRANASLICYRAGNLEGADHIVRRSVRDPDVDNGFVLQLGIEAMVELALQRHKPAETRDFILSIDAVIKEQGRVVISDDNWPIYMSVATLQKEAGNLAEARKIAEDTLAWIGRGNLRGPPGIDEWTRASALALLGRGDEAMLALENMSRIGNHLRWWVTLESDPNFAPLRGMARFQEFARQTREWASAQQVLVRTMRERGELISRHAPAPVDGC